MEQIINLTPDHEDIGVRLDKYISEELEEVSRSYRNFGKCPNVSLRRFVIIDKWNRTSWYSASNRQGYQRTSCHLQNKSSPPGTG